MNKARGIALGNTWRPRRFWDLTQPQILFVTVLATGAVAALAARTVRKC